MQHHSERQCSAPWTATFHSLPEERATLVNFGNTNRNPQATVNEGLPRLNPEAN